MTDKPVIHLRMPQRADSVAGAQPQPGAAPPVQPAPDVRTATQDPVLPVK